MIGDCGRGQAPSWLQMCTFISYRSTVIHGIVLRRVCTLLQDEGQCTRANLLYEDQIHLTRPGATRMSMSGPELKVSICQLQGLSGQH